MHLAGDIVNEKTLLLCFSSPSQPVIRVRWSAGNLRWSSFAS
jgi:hypothetical protein